MALKAFNNLVGPDGLVFTLLVFGAYFYMAKLNVLLLTVV